VNHVSLVHTWTRIIPPNTSIRLSYSRHASVYFEVRTNILKQSECPANSHSGKRVGRSSRQVGPTPSFMDTFTEMLSIKRTVFYRRGTLFQQFNICKPASFFSFIWSQILIFQFNICVHCDVTVCDNLGRFPLHKTFFLKTKRKVFLDLNLNRSISAIDCFTVVIVPYEGFIKMQRHSAQVFTFRRVKGFCVAYSWS
jgi:hypothetical protein